MNRNLVIAIIVILIIAIIGIFVFGQGNGKADTQITFLSKDTLKNGDHIEIQLKDASGKAIANQTVNFTYKANGNEEKYSVNTTNEGKAYLVLYNENPGQHEVTVSFNGTDKLKPCNATKTITIEEGNDAPATSDANSTANTIKYDNSTNTTQNQGDQGSQGGPILYYDAELNVYYDQYGIVHGGQSDGASIYYLRANPPQIDENGNLV